MTVGVGEGPPFRRVGVVRDRASGGERRLEPLLDDVAGRVEVEVGAAAEGSEPKEATIWLAVVQRSAQVAVKGGENRGKTLTYYNVVRELTPVGIWNGRPATIRLSRAAVMRPEAEDLIVLIQEASTGPIIGAARLGD